MESKNAETFLVSPMASSTLNYLMLSQAKLTLAISLMSIQLFLTFTIHVGTR